MTQLRRACDAFLCATPLLVAALAGIRALRIEGVYQFVGIALGATIAFSIWYLGWRAGGATGRVRSERAIAGAMLVTPFLLMGTLWVGLGTPWDATVSENEMRYLVLLAMAVAESVGFILAAWAITADGERMFAPLAGAAMSLAGPLYLVWSVLMFAAFSARARDGTLPSVFSALDEALDVMLFTAGALTYVAGLLLAASMGRVQWLGRASAVTFTIACGVALVFLFNRGLGFLAPADLDSSWYAAPGFVAGIPAVPFIVPCWLGVVLLRRAGAG